MKNIYRIFAVVLSTLLWFDSPVISQAEESTSGNDISVVTETEAQVVSEEEKDTLSENEMSDVDETPINVVSAITEQEEIVNIEISTASEDMFSFILDPQGLIPATDAVKYGGAEFSEGNLFFRNEEMRYSNTSNYIEIINKSNVEVEFTVTAVLNMDEKIVLQDKDAFSEDVCGIYMAIKDETDETPIRNQDGHRSVEITKIIPAMTDGNVQTYRFALTGACNTSDAWSEMTGDIPSVDITWSWEIIEKEELETQTYATEVVETEVVEEPVVTEKDNTTESETTEKTETVSGNDITEATTNPEPTIDPEQNSSETEVPAPMSLAEEELQDATENDSNQDTVSGNAS